MPPWTPSAWPSLVTGSEPSTHGIYDFHHYETGYNPEYVDARKIRTPFLWEYLSALGHASIVVNVPVTHPPHEFDGSLVPGYIAPEGTDCAINGEPTAIEKIFPDYRIYAKETNSKEAELDEYERLIDSRVRMADRLAEEHDWSFMMVQFQRTDSVFHKFGHDDVAVRRTYAAVDEAIGSLLDMVGEECTVFVVSDHGIHEYDSVFNCNTWLRDQGYLETTAESERASWGERAKADLRDSGNKDDESSYQRQVMEQTLDVLASIGITPQRAERALSTVGLEEPIRRFLPDDLLISAADHVDWEQSAAYCRSVSSLGIRCNVEGREQNGVVPADEFDELRTTLVEQLRNVRGPEGERVFEAVFDRHAVHRSDVPNERSAPDVVVRPKGMATKVSDVIRDRTFQPTDEFNHASHGLLIASGPNIESNVDIEPAITDVAPTLLRLFGHSTPETMDGCVLSELITHAPEPDPCPPPEPRTYFDSIRKTSNSDKIVQTRLKDMGYID